MVSMTMADWVSLAAAAALVSLALLAWLCWPGNGPLPMQWSLAGKPTWYAPRWLALSSMTVIGLLVLAVTAYASHQARAAGGRQIVIAVSVVALDAAYLYFAHRSI